MDPRNSAIAICLFAIIGYLIYNHLKERSETSRARPQGPQHVDIQVSMDSKVDTHHGGDSALSAFDHPPVVTSHSRFPVDAHQSDEIIPHAQNGPTSERVI